MPLHFRKKVLPDLCQICLLWTDTLPNMGCFFHIGSFRAINPALFKKTQLCYNSQWWNLEFSSQFFCATLDHITMTHSAGCNITQLLWYFRFFVYSSCPAVSRLHYITNITPKCWRQPKLQAKSGCWKSQNLIFGYSPNFPGAFP